jgi:hypothetical protein
MGLLLAGFGLLRFRSSGAPAAERREAEPEAVVNVRYGFSLVLSEPAERIELTDRTGSRLFEGGQSGPLSGTLELPHDGAIFVTIHWRNEPSAGEMRFAKLTLDPPGKQSLIRYFEAPGDIEDVWELPSA